MRTYLPKPIVPIQYGAPTDIDEVVVEWSISVFVEIVMLEARHFPSKTDRNFTFLIFIHAVAVGRTCGPYGMSTLVFTCPLVGSFGATWLGLR